MLKWHTITLFSTALCSDSTNLVQGVKMQMLAAMNFSLNVNRFFLYSVTQTKISSIKRIIGINWPTDACLYSTYYHLNEELIYKLIELFINKMIESLSAYVCCSIKSQFQRNECVLKAQEKRFRFMIVIKQCFDKGLTATA